MHARICFNSHLSVSKQLHGLEANVVSLDMSSLRLGDYPIDELEKLMSLIPASVLYLNLGTNRLHNLSGSNLQRFFMSIAKTKVQYVSLHHNELGSVSTEILLPAFEYLFGFLSALDLGYNEFWRKTSESWKCLFSSKPINHLEYLNLSGNFMITEGDELVEKMQSLLSLPVLRLSLALNQLGEKKSTDVDGLLRAISPEINILDLQKNSLHYLSLETLHELKGALPFIETLYVSSGEMNRMSYAQLDEFAKILPACKQVIAITRAHKMASSEKINYLQTKLPFRDALDVHEKACPLVDANKHDLTMFLSSSMPEKLAFMVKERTSFFGRLTSRMESKVDFKNNYVVGCSK